MTSAQLEALLDDVFMCAHMIFDSEGRTLHIGPWLACFPVADDCVYRARAVIERVAGECFDAGTSGKWFRSELRDAMRAEFAGAL